MRHWRAGASGAALWPDMANASDIAPVSAHDIDVLARTIFGEARGEPLDGQIAVGFVIRHRAAIALAFRQRHKRAHPLYGDGGIASACLKPEQFSCWIVGDPNQRACSTVTMASPAFQRCTYVAHAVLQGQVEDRLPRATHYCTPAAAPHIAWVIGVAAHDGKPEIPPAEKLGAICGHIFYAVSR
jgi:spore germination cell wall hydrolase CwlJ-like protein